MWSQVWEYIQDGDIFMAIFQMLLAVLSTIVSAILWPFSILIKQYLPDLDALLSSIGEYYQLAAQHLGWLINALGIPGVVLTLAAAFYVFKFAVTFTAWGVKLIIQWKKAVWA